VGKGLFPDASAEPVDEPPGAYWVEGLRIVELEDESGLLIERSRRVTGANTLVWAQGQHIYRIEGDLTREEAVAIAQSVR
jgi:hypothetical protein